MKRVFTLLVAAPTMAGCVLVSAHETEAAMHDAPPPEIARAYASPTAFYAKSIVIPRGYETIRLPGIIADPLPSGEWGDTERQADSAFSKIATALAELGASEADVVAMTVYLVAPRPGAAMDFDGMMRAYSKRYGSEQQPNRPARSTVQVAGLVRPEILVEIEVTAARRPQ